MKIYMLVFSILLLSSCTTTITMTDTHGKSSDVVDENASASADVKASATLPISAI